MSKEKKIEWNISAIHAIPSHLGMKNFIKDVEYIVTIDDGKSTASIGGKVGFELPEKRIKGFKRFDRLKTDELISWVKEAAGEEQVLSGLTANLLRQKKPTTVTVELSK